MNNTSAHVEGQILNAMAADAVNGRERFNNLTMNDDQLVAIMRKVIDISEWLIPQTKCFVHGDVYNGGPNHFYGNIKDNGGLFLVESYWNPGYIMTPLGEWAVTNGGECSHDWFKTAKDRLGLVVVQEHCNNKMGSYGPVYRITKDLEGNPLPEAIWEEQPQMHPDSYSGFRTTPNADYDTQTEIWERIAPRLNLVNPFKGKR
jgi:hypothetical protein